MPDERQGNPEKQPLPGSVSDQNAEEQEPGHPDQQENRRPPGSGGESGGGESGGGEASEGSQSTGNPDSAG